MIIYHKYQLMYRSLFFFFTFQITSASEILYWSTTTLRSVCSGTPQCCITKRLQLTINLLWLLDLPVAKCQQIMKLQLLGPKVENPELLSLLLYCIWHRESGSRKSCYSRSWNLKMCSLFLFTIFTTKFEMYFFHYKWINNVPLNCVSMTTEPLTTIIHKIRWNYSNLTEWLLMFQQSNSLVINVHNKLKN